MSHFCVFVIGDSPEKQLAPYNENLEFPLTLITTRAQRIEKLRQQRENIKNGLYAQYLADPVKYAQECRNPDHMQFISEEFPKSLEWTDEQLLAADDETEPLLQFPLSEEECVPGRTYEGPLRTPADGDKSYGRDQYGNIWSTANQQAKWDWYEVGGRYANRLILRSGIRANQTYFGEIDIARTLQDLELRYGQQYDAAEEHVEKHGSDSAVFLFDVDPTKEDKEPWVARMMKENVDPEFPFLVYAILKDGKWYQRGEMGWWGMSHNEIPEEQWAAEKREIFSGIGPDTLITMIDCHI